MPFGIVAIKLPPLKLAKLIRAHGQRQLREAENGKVRDGGKDRERETETEREDTGVNSCNRHASPALLLSPYSVTCLLYLLLLPFPASLPSIFRRKKRKTLDKVFAVSA